MIVVHTESDYRWSIYVYDKEMGYQFHYQPLNKILVIALRTPPSKMTFDRSWDQSADITYERWQEYENDPLPLMAQYLVL